MAEDGSWEATLRGLRLAVRSEVNPVAPGAVRARGTHRLRVRRATTAVSAAAATLAAVIGGASLVRGTAAPGPRPAASPTAVVTSSTPRPTLAVPAWPANPVGDPIARVDWAKATVQMPEHDGCPGGEFQFHANRAGDGGYPIAVLDPGTIAYGDLTGDGRPEAVLSASCLGGPEDSGDGQGQLLVVAREGDRLRGLAWVGPRGGLYPQFWIDKGVLYVDVHPWHTPWEYRLAQLQAYTWFESDFERVPSEALFRPLLEATGLGPRVDLGPVAARIGCPAASMRFAPDGTAVAGGVRWDVAQPAVPDDVAHWVDLDGRGDMRLLVAVTCDRPATVSSNWVGSVVVLERLGDEYRAVDAVRPSAGMAIGRWEYARGVLTLQVAPEGGGEVTEVPYTWNGSYFQR